MDITEGTRRVSGVGHVRALNRLSKVAVEGDIAFALINPPKKI